MYVSQNMNQYSKFSDIDNTSSDGQREENYISVTLNDLLISKNKRYMIVAEPGYGKTRLLKEIIIKAKDTEAFFIDAKKIKQLTIEDSLKKCKFIDKNRISEEDLQKIKAFKNTNNHFNASNNIIVCIDALDELEINELYDVIDKIDEFIEHNQEVKVFISCRMHHLKKVSFNFEKLDFNFITLDRFSSIQINNFLNKTLDRDINIKQLFCKSKVSNLSYFLSIPRYLYYFAELLKDKKTDIDDVINLSRVEMFEHFIYRKLNKELQSSTPQSKIDLLKRILEKLALIMKINGVSEISKDELMTIFDKMDSNFSQIAFRDDLIQKLYDRSLIKDNIDTIEFENQEFLDYLAAKELSRFERVEQAFFDLAIEPNILELYTSWFYVLPFLFELKPSIIELFLDFLQKNHTKVISSDYFNTLLDIEPDKISENLKSKIFDIVFDYHTEHIKWLDLNDAFLAKKLYRFLDITKFDKIKKSIDIDENSIDKLSVLATNATTIVGLLIKDNLLDDKQIKYWQDKVTKWLKLDTKKYKNLHSNVLREIANVSNNDFEWIKKHRFIFENGINVQDEYIKACYEIAPNDKFSIDAYLEADSLWRKNKIDGKNILRHLQEYEYILEINNIDSMLYALEKIWNNEAYFYKFCSIFDSRIDKDEKINIFKKNLKKIANIKLVTLFKKYINDLISDNNIHCRDFCNGVYKVLMEIVLFYDKSYINEFIKLVKNNDWLTNDWYPFSFVDIVSIDIVVNYLKEFEKAILNIDDKNIRLNLIKQIYYKSDAKKDIQKHIIEKYPNLIYSSIDSYAYKRNLKEKLCKEWIEKTEPKQNELITNLFEFYLQNMEDLKNCSYYKDYLIKMTSIAKEILKNQNPLKRYISKKENKYFRIKQYYYKSCIKFVEELNIKLDQESKDNIFKYLSCYGSSSHNDVITKLSINPSKEAIEEIVDAYTNSDSLSSFGIIQFVETYKKLKISLFEPILLKMLENKKIEEYKQKYIAQSLPKNILTVDILKKLRKNLPKDSQLSKVYLSLLVFKHKDEDAIDEAFKWLENKSKNTQDSKSRFNPMDIDEENIAFSLTTTKYTIEKDKELLLLSSKLSQKGQEDSSKFLINIVDNHLKYMIKHSNNAYKIILDIEKFLQSNKDIDTLHWFEYKIQDLKREYLSKIDKSNIKTAIKKYNKLEKEDYLPIASVLELKDTIKDILNNDIRRWIEDEGAYKNIQELAKKDNNTNAEDFIQKNIISQIELNLIKKGFRETDYKIVREEQLLDDKRLDITINYGFIGSVMIELKLSHNQEAKATTKSGREYNKKLKQYIDGAKCEYGIYAIFNVKEDLNSFKKQISKLKELYKAENKIDIIDINCVI